MIKTRIYLVVLAALMAPVFAVPTTVVLDPVADCIVKSDDPDASFSSGDLNMKWALADGETPAVAHIAYLQYQLPEDFGTATSVQTIATQIDITGNWGYRAILIDDDEVQGNPDSYTWNNAPGMLDRDLTTNPPTTGYWHDPDKAQYATYIAVSTAAGVGYSFVDSFLEQENFWAVTAFNQDTDGIITLMVHRRQTNATIVSGFAGLENETYNPIQLQVTYEPVPEPATIALLGLGMLSFFKRRVR